MNTIFKNSKLNFFFFAIILFLTSCLKDKEVFEQYPDNPWSGLQKSDLDVNGEIIDESGKAVSNVLITAANKTATTDKNGVFVIKKSQQSPDFIYVKAEKKGYFNGARVIRGTKNGQNVIKIMLVAQKKVADIKSSIGGEVTVDGVKITFPKNGYIDAAGKAFDGNINVFAKYLDPTKFETLLQMPGDFRATNFQGQERFLETFGMVYVELTDDNGNKLNLGNGGEAELSFENKNKTKHDKIPLWHFDEKIGSWREEGTTLLVNNRYVGKVSHFSCWNCDFQYEKVFAKGRIVDQNGNPMANVWVGLNLVGQGWGGHGSTDANGVFMGCIPKGQDLELSVNVYGSGCNSLVYKKAVGSFTADVDFKDVVVTLPVGSNPIKSISGTATDCSGGKLKNGYVFVVFKGGGGQNQNAVIFTDSLGKFNYTLTPSICLPDFTSANIIVSDLTNKKESQTKTVSLATGNNDVGNIDVCSTITQFIDFKFGDSTFYTILPQASEIYMSSDSLTGGGGPQKVLNMYLSGPQSSQKDNKFLTFNVKVTTNPPVIGTYPLVYQYGYNVLPGGGTSTVPPIDQNLTMTLTEVSLTSGQFIAGSISGTMKLISGPTINVSGSFRVKKI